MAKVRTEIAWLDEVSKKKHPGAPKIIGMYYPEELTLIKDRNHFLYDPRVEFDFDDNIVKTMMEIGVDKAVSVYKQKNDEGNQCALIVIDGRQTIINAIEANRRLEADGKPKIKIPADIKDGNEADFLRRMVVNNEHRIPDDAITKGFKAKRCIGKGIPLEIICQDFNVVEETIKNWIKLTELCSDVQAALRNEEITMNQALRLVGLKVDEQKAKCLEFIQGRTARGSGGGRAHKGQDKRRIKRMCELNAAKDPAIKRVLAWMSGETDDDAVKDLFDFSVLEKKGDGVAPKKRGRKPKDQGADDLADRIAGKAIGRSSTSASSEEEPELDDDTEDDPDDGDIGEPDDDGMDDGSDD